MRVLLVEEDIEVGEGLITALEMWNIGRTEYGPHLKDGAHWLQPPIRPHWSISERPAALASI